MDQTALPEIMANSNIDLASTSGGKFSPQDWERILERARTLFHEKRLSSADDASAWHQVVAEFHRSRYWGFVPNYRPTKEDIKAERAKKKSGLGIQFVWLTFGSLTIMKVAVLWFGQIYSRSDDPFDAWLFYFVLAAVVLNYAYFLWRNRHYQD